MNAPLIDGQSVVRRISLTPLFPLGRLLATPGALKTLEEFSISPHTLLSQHVRGDFGDLCNADWAENLTAIRDGLRVFSAYTLKRQVDDRTETEKVWIITEADRRSTTILMPVEY